MSTYNPKNEIKLMILYMLKNVSFSLNHENLSNFFLDKYTTFIIFQDILSDLVETKLIDEYKTKTSVFYKATIDGAEALDTFINDISPEHKKELDDYIKENKFKHKWLEEKGHVVNVTGELDVEEAQVWFKIMSLNGNGVRRISRHFLFKVLPCNIHTLPEGSCDANGEELPPVEVLLGAPFMAREKWVLDFGAKIMYKRKVA